MKYIIYVWTSPLFLFKEDAYVPESQNQKCLLCNLMTCLTVLKSSKIICSALQLVTEDPILLIKYCVLLIIGFRNLVT